MSESYAVEFGPSRWTYLTVRYQNNRGTDIYVRTVWNANQLLEHKHSFNVLKGRVLFEDGCAIECATKEDTYKLLPL